MLCLSCSQMLFSPSFMKEAKNSTRSAKKKMKETSLKIAFYIIFLKNAIFCDYCYQIIITTPNGILSNENGDKILQNIDTLPTAILTCEHTLKLLLETLAEHFTQVEKALLKEGKYACCYMF